MADREEDLSGQEQEQIRQDIVETRSSLGEKLEALESEVRDHVFEAKALVLDKMEDARATVREAQRSAKEQVKEVKQAISLTHHVEEHPWACFGASIVVGMVLGSLLPTGSSSAPELRFDVQSLPATNYAAAGKTSNGAGNGHSNGHSNGHTNGHHDGLKAKAMELFDDEIQQLKGMALGMLFSVVRDLVKDAVPSNLSSRVSGVVDSVTRKLGGTPVSARPATASRASN